MLVVALTTIGFDRVTKHAAMAALAGMPGRSFLADTVRLGYVENPGGFLSIGASWPPVFRTAVFTVLHEGFCTRGSARRVLDEGFCTNC